MMLLVLLIKCYESMKKELIEGFNKMPEQEQNVLVIAEYLHKEIMRAQMYACFKCGFYGDNEKLRKEFEAENESVEKLAGIIGRVDELVGFVKQTKNLRAMVLNILCNGIEEQHRALLFFERVCYSKGLFECAQIVRVLQLFFETIKEIGESNEEECAVRKLLEANVFDESRASIWFSMYKQGLLMLDEVEKKLRINLNVLETMCGKDNRQRGNGAGASLLYGLALCMFGFLECGERNSNKIYTLYDANNNKVDGVVNEIDRIFIQAITHSVQKKRSTDKTYDWKTFGSGLKVLCDYFKIDFPSSKKQ